MLIFLHEPKECSWNNRHSRAVAVVGCEKGIRPPISIAVSGVEILKELDLCSRHAPENVLLRMPYLLHGTGPRVVHVYVP